ncbi:hypothetical protein [Singulisphaera sp. PoT]|uniref:hypothetical protein n=1 Tax=Singulisphaera sp. PoT TaxID=3411797 RepID=UPI003BF47045
MPGLVTIGYGTGGVVGSPGIVTMGLGSNAPIAADAFNLITVEYTANILEAAGVVMTQAQRDVLPALITAASKEIERFCNRPFVLLNYDEIATPEGGRQDRGEPASFMLSRHPVKSIARVHTGRATALRIRNTDQGLNQYATVQFAAVGDVDYLDLQYTGILLNRVSSGTQTSRILTFAEYGTVQLLADAINGLGYGWEATVTAAGLASNVGRFPSADLVGLREPKNALGDGAGVDLFMKAASQFDIDRATGIVRVYGWDGFSIGFGGGWGDPFGASWDGLADYGGGQLGWGQFRVSYQAGYSVIPEPIQFICAELVKVAFDRMKINPYVASETLAGAEHSISFREIATGMTEEMRQQLTKYKDYHV